MYSLDKKHTSNILYQGLLNQYPNYVEALKRETLIDTSAKNLDQYLEYLLQQILVNPDEIGVNKKATMRFVDGAEAFALVSPESDKTPEYLYKAAEIARTMHTMPKALSIYDWILEDYPNFDKVPTIMFIKGFILEQDFKKTEEARAIYTQFLEKYPQHQMASSAKFLLENLGKSEEEILNKIHQKDSEEIN